MLKIALAAALAATAALPAQAQSQTAQQTAPAAKYTLNTPIATIAADPKGAAALDAALPALRGHDMYDSFKHMSLNELMPMSGGQLTEEMLKTAEAELAKVK